MRIVIVDDDRLVCSSLKVILEMDSEIKVDAIGNDGCEAVTLYEQHVPDVLLMDIRMVTMSGIEAAEQILVKHKNAKILFLTTFSDDEYIVKALKIGAKGYLLKQDYDSILPALKAVSIGQSVFGSDVITKLPDLMQKKKEFPYEKYQLTKKEYELLSMVAEGLSNKEIADAMFLGEGTVRNYLSNLLLKLDVRDRTQAAIFYYKQMQ